MKKMTYEEAKALPEFDKISVNVSYEAGKIEIDFVVSKIGGTIIVHRDLVDIISKNDRAAVLSWSIQNRVSVDFEELAQIVSLKIRHELDNLTELLK